MKATRVCLLLLAAFLCLSPLGLAQSHPPPSFSQQHKDAEKYQKHLIKERRKQEKKARTAKPSRNHHH